MNIGTFRKFVQRTFKRGRPLTSCTTISVDTITEIDYPPEAETMFADLSETCISNDLSLGNPAGPYTRGGTRGGDNTDPVACSVTSDKPVLILSSLSQYAEHPETSLESPIDDMDDSSPFSLALVTTARLSFTKRLLPGALGHVGVHSTPLAKQGAPQYDYVPDECDIWIHFYIFRDMIVGVTILPAYGIGILMWCPIRASGSRTRTQPSPAMNRGERRHAGAFNSHPKLAAMVPRLLENKPILRLAGYERETAIAFTAHQERAVAANAPHTFFTNARRSVDHLPSTWKTWSDSSMYSMRTAQWLSISAQILSLLLVWSLWTS